MLDLKILRELEETLGRGRVKTDMESLISYSYDGTFQERLPDAVVKAHDVSEGSNIMKISGAYGVPVVPRGAGTGL
ncbi:MAG: glycolate oxidase subunit GlcD, partial [Desulfitobacteriaceae bacterium]|nr:glycolate oxidase subunit GlcD [Desulfitobacteriaceae bacterium]